MQNDARASWSDGVVITHGGLAKGSEVTGVRRGHKAEANLRITEVLNP